MKAQFCRKWEECSICGAPGHHRDVCPLRNHYHIQATRAVLAGKATPDDVVEAFRPVDRDSQRVN